MNVSFDKTDRLIAIIETARHTLSLVEYLACGFEEKCKKSEFQPLFNRLVEITNSDDDETTKSTNREKAFADHYQLHLNKKIDGRGMLTHIFDENEVIRYLARAYWQVQTGVKYRPNNNLRETLSKQYPDDPYLDIIEDVLLKQEPLIEDIEAEFWANCPDVNQIDAFCNIYRERWRGKLSRADMKHYDFQALLFNETNKLHRGLAALRECGLLSISERFVEARLHHTAQSINYRCDSVVTMFQKFKAMTKPSVPVANIPPNGTLHLPESLNTPRAQKYISKAVKAGLVELTSTGGKWIGGTKVLLAYFCKRLFCENDNGTDNRQPFPEAALNQYWNVSRLGRACSQIISNKSGNGKPKNHQIIDILFSKEATD
jgi:hypothetical protein